MKNFLLSLLLLVTLCLLCGTLFACREHAGVGEGKTDPPGESVDTPADTKKDSIDTSTVGTDPSTEAPTDPEKEPETEPHYDLAGPFGSAIQEAYQLANDVQAYYTASNRASYRIENQNMSLEYALLAQNKPMVTAIRNRKGYPYLQNTMDAFVRMTDGQTYYASDTSTSARPNTLMYGYYYYEQHFFDQDFAGAYEIVASEDVNIRHFRAYSPHVADVQFEEGVLSFSISGSDPFVYTTDKLSFPVSDYNAVQITIRTTHALNAGLYVVSGVETGHTAAQHVDFALTADGEFHTYTIPITDIPGLGDTVKNLRLDIEHTQINEVISIKDVKLLKIDGKAPPIVFDRTLHTYSDKLNQVLHFIAKETTTGIDAFGMKTEIMADTVEKLTVVDAKGTHDTLDGVDWTSAVAVGFDIKDVGVFGYILLPHENSGTLNVTLTNGVYTLTQTATPEDGTLLAMGQYTENDFYMGHRLYTDTSHSFDDFLSAVAVERNPLTVIGGNTYVGYDALRGAYAYSIGGTTFNPAFFNAWNRHYTADVKIEGAKEDRTIYIYSNCSENGGSTEGAALLDSEDLQIPIPVMIFKNFGGENEEPVFYHGDRSYSITLFPMTVEAGVDKSFTILNAMQNWGKYPLKQLSSIQFFAPYYHLSTGVTETSCIAPWYVHGKSLWTLPDFRPMSGKWWFEYTDERFDNQPQHTHSGYHYFLQYTDTDGLDYASENVRNTIISSGLNYSEVIMDYLSDDGKIKVSYNHIEMPQTDEHRAYYEMTYEVLEDVKIRNFREDFSFLSTRAYGGTYHKIGYLNEQNEIIHDRAPVHGFIRLGNDHPYVSFYSLKGDWENKCGNTGFLITDASFTIGGKAYDGGFGLFTEDGLHYLTLDLGEVTLKKGDTMTIHMVIVPWGSEESVDDSNMIALRENTALDPVKLTVTSGEVLPSAFLPRVRTTNGTSAEFTLSGGTNHIAVRVYGFHKLTAPIIYEKINGEWLEYKTASTEYPDTFGTVHPYDGYFAYYDGDGTYSYTFLADMTNADTRTFRIEAAEAFTGWPEGTEPDHKDPMPVYSDPSELALQATQAAKGVGGAEVSEDASFVRIFGDGASVEAYFTAFTAIDDIPTGHYMVIKYRYPTGSTYSDMEIFTSTVNPGAIGGESFPLRGLSKDGEWHVALIDLSAQGLPTFEATSDGSYLVKYVRLDVFNDVIPTNAYVDLAYVGIADSLDAICEWEEEIPTATVHTRGPVTAILDLESGEIIKNP